MRDQQSHEGQHPRDQEVFRGRLITVVLRPVSKPDGSESLHEIVEHSPAVAVVAVRYDTSAGNTSGEPLVALVHQHRPAIDKDTLELPAGLVNADERDAPMRAAARELREETGFTAGTLRLLTREYSSPGFTDEAIFIYLATDVKPADQDAVPDPSEIAKVEWLALSEAMRLVRDGDIADGKTLIGLWLARDLLTADAFQDEPPTP